MDSKNYRAIELAELKPGERLELINTSTQASQYTFDFGEYGKLSFTLIIGSTLTYTAGTVVPKIIQSNPN